MTDQTKASYPLALDHSANNQLPIPPLVSLLPVDQEVDKDTLEVLTKLDARFKRNGFWLESAASTTFLPWHHPINIEIREDKESPDKGYIVNINAAGDFGTTLKFIDLVIAKAFYQKLRLHIQRTAEQR